MGTNKEESFRSLFEELNSFYMNQNNREKQRWINLICASTTRFFTKFQPATKQFYETKWVYTVVAGNIICLVEAVSQLMKDEKEIVYQV